MPHGGFQGIDWESNIDYSRMKRERLARAKASLKEKGLSAIICFDFDKVNVGRFPMMANGKAKIQGEQRGLIKVISEPKYGEIVGVHMYCVHATDMIAEAAAAMKLESTAEELAATIHPHPTVSEAVMEAMHAVTGKAIHC